jgi:hypothetical protein
MSDSDINIMQKDIQYSRDLKSRFFVGATEL